jgi:hypothetical protein
MIAVSRPVIPRCAPSRPLSSLNIGCEPLFWGRPATLICSPRDTHSAQDESTKICDAHNVMADGQHTPMAVRAQREKRARITTLRIVQRDPVIPTGRWRERRDNYSGTGAQSLHETVRLCLSPVRFTECAGTR